MERGTVLGHSQSFAERLTLVVGPVFRYEALVSLEHPGHGLSSAFAVAPSDRLGNVDVALAGNWLILWAAPLRIRRRRAASSE